MKIKVYIAHYTLTIIFTSTLIPIWSHVCRVIHTLAELEFESKSSGNKLVFFLLLYTALYMLEIKRTSYMLRIVSPSSSTYQLSDLRKVTLICFLYVIHLFSENYDIFPIIIRLLEDQIRLFCNNSIYTYKGQL